MESNIWEGVAVGASGGSIAGITVYLIQYLHQKLRDYLEMRSINKWLKENSTGGKWRTTRTIASWTNLPEDRVQYLCSKDKEIKLSTGENEGLWAHRETVNKTDC
ncbi:hypothetical protein [Amphritea balenae]|uniref:Uncharacterized protein n=1 Tax=Amphritea balenae TaxID=452629 RepID=A0A3P1SRM7_9GAMM|nr:hypothetical protein [Amphritea balenae]RRC99554.1 hypothetical protein EHS89_08595 [Amphritea balenae]GGK77998.1 hypothetical protein GCM10007941_30100 [Amphritea balenae]